MALTSLAITRLASKVRLYEQKLRETVVSVQQKCKHDSIAECAYKPFKYSSALSPVRICLHCGLTEEGWGCGYLVLKDKKDSVVGIPAIDRDVLYQLRVGKYIVEKDKGPLLRKEKTLNELIAEV